MPQLFKGTPMEDKKIDWIPNAITDVPRIWAYNKMRRQTVTMHDEPRRTTVFDYLKENNSQIFETFKANCTRFLSIGRLDYMTEGLLLFTNSGDMKSRLELPKYSVIRRYLVSVVGSQVSMVLIPSSLLSSNTSAFHQIPDVLFQHVKHKPESSPYTIHSLTIKSDCKLQPLLLHQHPTQTWLQIELMEGKNREIRNFLAEYGLIVTRLIRIGYGSFSLGDLKPGELREVPVGWGDVPGMDGWTQKQFAPLDKAKKIRKGG